MKHEFGAVDVADVVAVASVAVFVVEAYVAVAAAAEF